MIDTQTVLPASVCAKADKYSFSDFLPACHQLLHRRRARSTRCRSTRRARCSSTTRRRSPRPASTPRSRRRRSTRCAAAAEKLKADGGRRAPLGLKLEPGYFEQWRAMANKLFVNNSNGRKARATKAVFDDADRARDLHLDVGMVKDGLADDQPRPSAPSQFDNLLGIGNGNARDGDRHQRVARHDHAGARRRRRTPTSSSASAPMPGPGRQRAACSCRAARCSW